MAIDTSDPVKYLKGLRELQAKRKANWQKRAEASRREKKCKAEPRAVLKAFDEARRNIFGNRRGGALIVAYDDAELQAKFSKEYLRILAREEIEQF